MSTRRQYNREMVDTQGVVFYRENPYNPKEPGNGERNKKTERMIYKYDGTPAEYKFNSGESVDGGTCTNLPADSAWKYRIPPTSVVNKKGNVRLFLFCGPRPTGGQWIWILNAFCFLAHLFMFGLTLGLGFWRHGDALVMENMEVRVFRLSANWTSTGANGYDIVLKDNDMPINICWLTASFFLISACFHLWACLFGLYERWWYFYWRCAV